MLRRSRLRLSCAFCSDVRGCVRRHLHPLPGKDRDRREGGHPPRGQEQRVPGGHHPRRRARTRPQRPPGVRRARRRPGSSIPDEEYVTAGGTILADRRRGVGDRRPAAEGQGADRGGVPPSPQGPDPLHLPAPGGLPRVHRRPAGLRHHRHRLRDRRDGTAARCRCWPRCPRSPAARPAGRRLPPDALGGRPGRAARWRARHRRGPRRGHRRRRLRLERHHRSPSAWAST